MGVIGILGSPVPGGNTARLFNRAMDGASDAGCDIEKIIVEYLDFQACSEQMFCVENETCIIDDDMQQVYLKIRDADGIVIASPVMTMGIPGRLKSFMDRFQVFYSAKYMRKKPLVQKEKRETRKGLFISISGMNRPDVFMGSKDSVHAFFDIIDCEYSDELLIPDMDTILDVTKRPDLLAAAYEKGRHLGMDYSKQPGSAAQQRS